MNALLSFKKALLLCTIIVLCVTLTSWNGGVAKTTQQHQDTIPAKDHKKIVDLDDALEELDAAKADVEKSVRDIDWDKMDADLKASMKDLDVNLKQMDVDMKAALKEIDVAQLKQDVEASVAKIDWDEIKRNIENAKKVSLEDVKAEVELAKQQIQKQKPEIEKSLANARKSIDKAKAEMQAYKTFVNGLEEDGLINKKESYTIEHKGGTLRINDKEQPGAVYEKYRAFLDKHPSFTLEKTNDDFKLKSE